jgi:hypothetical protein
MPPAQLALPVDTTVHEPGPQRTPSSQDSSPHSTWQEDDREQSIRPAQMEFVPQLIEQGPSPHRTPSKQAPVARAVEVQSTPQLVAFAQSMGPRQLSSSSEHRTLHSSPSGHVQPSLQPVMMQRWLPSSYVKHSVHSLGHTNGAEPPVPAPLPPCPPFEDEALVEAPPPPALAVPVEVEAPSPPHAVRTAPRSRTKIKVCIRPTVYQ